MKQSDVFIADQANAYFSRNGLKRGFLAEIVLSLFPRNDLRNFDIAEFGCNAGQNLLALAPFVRSARGFEGSTEAVECFSDTLSNSKHFEHLSVVQQNVCEEFEVDQSYDIIIFGFFAYYASDPELSQALSNALKQLKPGGYLLINDFLSADINAFDDAYDKRLKVHKRNLPFWLSLLAPNPLLYFRLFDDLRLEEFRLQERHSCLDLSSTYPEKNWNFCAVFKCG